MCSTFRQTFVLLKPVVIYIKLVCYPVFQYLVSRDEEFYQWRGRISITNTNTKRIQHKYKYRYNTNTNNRNTRRVLSVAWEEVHRQTLGFPSLRIRQMSARIIWRSPPKIMSLLRRNSWDTMAIILKIGLSLILTICHFESHLWEHDQWVCPTLFPQQIIEARASC